MKKLLGLMILSLGLILPQTLLADTVKVKESGESFDGIIIYKNDQELWLDIGTGKLIFKIKEVTFEYNKKGEKAAKKRRHKRLSVIGVAPDEKSSNDGNKKSGNQSSSSNSSNSSNSSSSAKKEKVEETVPPEELNQIKRNIRELQRFRPRNRNNALRRLKDYAAKYPHTVTKLLVAEINHQFPRVRRMVCEILGQTGIMKPAEELVRKLRDKDKWVRHAAAEALNKLTKQSIPYPEPSPSLDHEIKDEESRAIDQWHSWWNTYETKRIQEELKKEQEKKKTTTNEETNKLLKKLKGLLEKNK